MSALTDFLLARIQEDEERYRETAGDERNQQSAFNSPDLNEGYIVAEALRCLAECEAKRRIVELHAQLSEDSDTEYSGWVDLAHNTLATLALPYADHPDYNTDWRPTSLNHSI